MAKVRMWRDLGSARPSDFLFARGQTADSIVERLASKYGQRFELMVATSDYLEQQTANACGAECISPDMLRGLMQEARTRAKRQLRVNGSSSAEQRRLPAV